MNPPSQFGGASGRACRGWMIALLVVLGLAAFARAISGEFLPWDDDLNVTQNSHLAPLNAANLEWMFTDVQSTQRYKPITWLIWSITEACAGLNAPAFHGVNIALHLANGILVFLALRALMDLREGFRRQSATGDARATTSTARQVAALAGAVLWELHPLRVEPVAWVVGLTYLLCTGFALLSILAYLRTWSTGGAERARWLLLAAVAYVLSIASYPATLLLPAFLCALDWLILQWISRAGPRVGPGFQRLAAEKILFLVPAAVVLAATLVARMHAQGQWHAPRALGAVGPSALAMQGAYVWAHYVFMTFWPARLSPVYLALWHVDPSAPRFVFSALFVGAASVAALLVRKRAPEAPALWFSYLALMVPALGFTELPHFPCDRYSYFPSLCFAAGLAFGMAPLLGRGLAAGLAVAGAAVCAGLFAWRDIVETAKWHDARALFYCAIASVGDDPYRADLYWRMGAAYLNEGRFDRAAAEFDKALAVKQDARLPRYFRAVARFNLGRYREAAADFETSLAFEESSPTAIDAGIPSAAAIRFNLSMAYAKARMWKEAFASRPPPGGFPAERLVPLFDEIAAGLKSAGMPALAARVEEDSAAAGRSAAGRPPLSAK